MVTCLFAVAMFQQLLLQSCSREWFKLFYDFCLFKKCLSGSCGRGYETSGFIKDGGFLEYLSDCSLLKKNSFVQVVIFDVFSVADNAGKFRFVC